MKTFGAEVDGMKNVPIRNNYLVMKHGLSWLDCVTLVIIVESFFRMWESGRQ